LGLPKLTLAKKIGYSSHSGLMAKLEKGEIMPSQFAREFEEECKLAGINISGKKMMKMMSDVKTRPEYISTINNLRKNGVIVGAITNNWKLDTEELDRDVARVVFNLFDFVIESSRVGIRKPDPAIFQLALDKLKLPGSSCIFLDDLGMNLKTAKKLGITTILVEMNNPSGALLELNKLLPFPAYIPQSSL